MTNIELVIKIPKEVKNRLCFGVTYAKDIQTVCEALHNGTPLPKGHGELVDRNDINERYDSIYNDAINCSNQPSDKYLLDKLSMCLDTALPIIAADVE